MASVITFTCFEGDKPIEVQLEPEALLFRVMPGNELTLKSVSLAGGNFEWSIRINHNAGGIQVFPDAPGPWEIEIFENETLLQDWYKYM